MLLICYYICTFVFEMKNIHIKQLTGIGLITVVILQTIWLCNTYIILNNNIIEKGNTLLQEATDREMFFRLDAIKNEIPSGTEFVQSSIKTSGEMLPESSQFQEVLSKFNSKIVLSTLDSIYNELLSEANIHIKTIINIVDSKGTLLESTKKERQPFLGIIKTKIIPIRVNRSQNIQAVLFNPYWAIFQQMGLLFIATAVMMAFVGFCIAYQIKIIIQQRQIAEVKDTFSNAMIHDMKTPLAGIKTGTHILRQLKPGDIEKRDKYLNLMNDESDHLYSLANRVLTIAKLDKDEIHFQKIVINLESMVRNLIDKFTVKANKQTDFFTYFGTTTAWADEEYLKEAISNLIDNAIKYSGKSVSIEISCKEENGLTWISVKDNGFGISEKDQERIFEKFKRSKDALKRQRNGGATGFGLGLNYVRRVIEAHGGSVDVISVEGKYSEFIINLPQITK